MAGEADRLDRGGPACPEGLVWIPFGFCRPIPDSWRQATEPGLMKHIAGDFLVDMDSREVRGSQGIHTLEPRAAAVLSHLLHQEGEVVSRAALIEACWPAGGGSDEALTQTVAQLRRAFGDDPRRPRYIATIYKGGYRWRPQPAPAPTVKAMPVRDPAPERARATRSRLIVAGLLIAVFVGGLAGAGVFGLLTGTAPGRVAVTSEDRQVLRTVENGRLVESETKTINRPRP